jgi:glutamine phosphoribosylpyrophosphate amidotransferase
MCGIVGLHGTKQVNPQQLKAGTDAILHRGPDGEGFWISADGRTGLGHRRLSIVDLSTGGQPILSEDGKKAVIVNGEFYGHPRDPPRPGSPWPHFSHHSDSEIVLHLYEEYGTECLKYLRGEFAFILQDDEKIFYSRRVTVSASSRSAIPSMKDPCCWPPRQRRSLPWAFRQNGMTPPFFTPRNCNIPSRTARCLKTSCS